MNKITLVHDAVAQTLTVWFAPARRATVNEEAEGDVFLKRDDEGRLVGLELRHYRPGPSTTELAVETVLVTGP